MWYRRLSNTRCSTQCVALLCACHVYTAQHCFNIINACKIIVFMKIGLSCDRASPLSSIQKQVSRQDVHNQLIYSTQSRHALCQTRWRFNGGRKYHVGTVTPLNSLQHFGVNRVGVSSRPDRSPTFRALLPQSLQGQLGRNISQCIAVEDLKNIIFQNKDQLNEVTCSPAVMLSCQTWRMCQFGAVFSTRRSTS